MTYYNFRGIAMKESGPETGRLLGTSAGGETIQAGVGNVSLAGDGGGDTLIGSAGDNHIWITDPRDVVLEALNGGVDTEIGYMSVKLAPNVENLEVHGDFNFAVGNSLDNLIVVDGSQWVVGGKGDDVLVGSPTQRTTFAFQAGDGHDVIYNWNANAQLQLVGYDLKSPADIHAAMSQLGADTLLTLSATDSVLIRNTTPAAFEDRQFLSALDTSKLGAMTFSDEFDTLKIRDPSTGAGQWQTNFGGNLKDQWAYSLVSNGEQQAYVAPGFQGRGEQDIGVNPFSVSGGVLTITAAPVAAADSYAAYGREYTSGMLNTVGSFAQKYGYFEMRAELPTAAGAWPAFWMIPSPYAANQEADIMEGLAATPHVDYRHAIGGADGGEGLYDNIYKAEASGAHTYGMLWTPTTLTFYYDGTAVLQGAAPSNWTNPMALIVNLAVGGWGGSPDGAAFPATMKIDYIHAYALADGSSEVVATNPAAPVDTLRDEGSTHGETGLAMTFEASGGPTAAAQIEISAGHPAVLPPGQTMMIWEDSGAVFGAVSDGKTLAEPTALMAGTASQFTGAGAWLTDGKVVISYYQPNAAGGHDLWDMVFDPVRHTFVRQDLGAAAPDAHAVFIATDLGGFAVSWHGVDGQVLARAYDEYAYGGDVPGWYGPTRQITGDLIGVHAQGQVVAVNGAGQEVYSLYQASTTQTSGVSITTAQLSHAEGDSGDTAFVYTLTRSGPATDAASVAWAVAGAGAHPADAADFHGQTLPSGIVEFAAGEVSKTVTVNVAADLKAEADETFTLSLSNPVGLAVRGAAATGVIVNDDAVVSTGNGSTTGAAGLVLTASGPGATLTGGAGGDTLNASQGQDVLTGGAGADRFVIAHEPWSPDQITDFVVGTDKLDISALLLKACYSGADPVADHFVILLDDGQGGTKLLFDRDGAGPAPQWANYIVQLDHVSATGLTWAALTGDGNGQGPATPPAAAGVVLISSAPGSTLLGSAGDDTLFGGQGQDVLTGGPGADHFAFTTEPWSPERITDFTVGSDKLDLSALLKASGYTGSAPVEDHYITLIDDGAGGTKLLFDHDGAGPSPEWANYIVQLDHVPVAGLTWAALSGDVGAAPGTGGGPGPGPAPATSAMVVFAGQSNMGAPYEDATTVSSQWVSSSLTKIWNDSAHQWENLQPGVNTGYSGAPQGWGPEVQFALDFRAAHPGETLYIVKSVFGGTQLAQDTQQFHADWSPQSSGEMFDQTTQLIGRASAAAGGLTPTAVFYGQGEEDANHQPAALAYGDNLTGLFSAIRASWLNDPSGKIGFFEIGPSPVYATDVRAGELRVDAADPNAASFDSLKFTVQSDGLHFSASALNTAGDSFFQLYQGWAGSTPGGGGNGAPGMVLTAAGPGATLTGGDGADTLHGSQGQDLLTGGPGADLYQFANEPWSPERISDFAVGVDKLDLSQLFLKAGYAGSDPVADHYVTFIDDGAGGAKLIFDRDGAGPSPPWGNYIVQLDHVSTVGLTWADISGGTVTPAPAMGQVLTATGPGAILTGGAGDDTFHPSQGQDVLTGGPGADVYAFSKEPWSPIRITDFAVGSDRLDLSALFQLAGYAGKDPIADHVLTVIDDGAGGAKLLFDADGPGPNPQWANYIIQLDHVSSVGLTWANLTGGAAAAETAPAATTTPAPLAADSVQISAAAYVLTASAHNATLVGATSQSVTGNALDNRLISNDYGSTLSGGDGADILTVGHGADLLTGGAGADIIVISLLPWNAGHVTDFTPGLDKLDLTALFAAAAYRGSTPIADGYLSVQTDGADGARVMFDMDGSGAGRATTLVILDHVSPKMLTALDWIV